MKKKVTVFLGILGLGVSCLSYFVNSFPVIQSSKISNNLNVGQSEFDKNYESIMNMIKRNTNESEKINRTSSQPVQSKRVVFKDKSGNFRLCSGNCSACGACI